MTLSPAGTFEGEAQFGKLRHAAGRGSMPHLGMKRSIVGSRGCRAGDCEEKISHPSRRYVMKYQSAEAMILQSMPRTAETSPLRRLERSSWCKFACSFDCLAALRSRTRWEASQRICSERTKCPKIRRKAKKIQKKVKKQDFWYHGKKNGLSTDFMDCQMDCEYRWTVL